MDLLKKPPCKSCKDVMLLISDMLQLSYDTGIQLYHTNATRLMDSLNLVKQDLMKQSLKRIVEQSLRDGTCDDISLTLLYQQPVKKEYNYLITISFKQSVQPSLELQKTISNFICRKNIIYSRVVHEQRGEIPADCGRGYHIHINNKYNITQPRSILLRNTLSSFKDYVDGINFIDIRKIGMDNGVDRYMNGEKSDNLKLSKVEIDKMFNEKYKHLFSPSIVNRFDEAQ